MTDRDHRLKKSKVFCMAPWVSINNNPNGDIIPCCVYRGKPMGNLYKESLEDIWNGEEYKTIRKKMMNDEPISDCERCYKEEEWGSSSYKRHWNELYYQRYKDLVEDSTDADGHLNKMNLYRWDFRFNNLCNLSCIGCGPDFSSSWVELNKKMWPNAKESKIYSSRENKEKFIETIKSQSSIVENIYFAGGEPLLHPEQYEIVSEIDRLNKLDKVDFMYSTNLTNLYYKDQYILDYWNKMKRCKVVVSIDEVDAERLHYIRYPSDLNTIIDNIKIIKKSLNTKNKHWSITPTWNILNTHRMKEIISYFYENDLLPESFNDTILWETDIHNIILMFPRHLSISFSPPEWKEHLHQKMREFEEWYSDVMLPLKTPDARFFASKILKNNMEKFRNAIDEPVDDNKMFREWYRRMDSVRGTDFKKTFPELAWHVDRLT